jgi:hypothetical protein
VPASNLDASQTQQSCQQAWSCKWMREVKLVHPAHQLHIHFADLFSRANSLVNFATAD